MSEDGKAKVENLLITIFEGSVNELSSENDQSLGKEWSDNKLNQKQKLAAVAVHEIHHAIKDVKTITSGSSLSKEDHQKAHIVETQAIKEFGQANKNK